MGKKHKPLLAVQGIVHLTESFVQPSQESGLLNTVGGDTECAALILAPNYGYAISASSLANKADAEKKNGEAKEKDEVQVETGGTDNIENETPNAEADAEPDKTTKDLSVAELVRHIGGAKDKPLVRGDVMEDRPESERPQTSSPVEEDDAETTEFYESLGITRSNAAPKTAAPVLQTEKAIEDSGSPAEANSTEEKEKSVPESVAEFYKNYPTQYYYSVSSDPYGTQPLEFSLPISTSFQENEKEGYSIIEVARRAQRAKREYNAKKAALERKNSKKNDEDDDEAYDPLPMEVVPTYATGPKGHPEESSFKTYWDYVQENPHEFNRWTFLINYAENTVS